MKHTKKLVSLLLALVMLLSLGVSAFAAEGNDAEAAKPIMQGPEKFNDTENNGSGQVIVTNAVPNETYSIYQILYLESYDITGTTTDGNENTTGGKYAYIANSYWKPFVESTAISGVFMKTDENGYVTWSGGTGTNTDIAEFAKLAIAYAKGQGKEGDADYRAPLAAVNTQTPTAADSGKKTATVTFDNLKLGYYLVDTSLGSLCALDTTNTTVKVTEKNSLPTNVKQVKEDSTEHFNGTADVLGTNTADIGQTVEFRSTVSIKNGVENLCFHDTMTEGLTFHVGSVSITLNGTTLTKGTDYTVIPDSTEANSEKPEDECTFHVNFTEAFYERITGTANYNLVISYSATVNEKAKIGTDENTNKSQVSYGDKNSITPPSTTITKTYEFPVFKFAFEEDGTTKKGLSDTHFILGKNVKDEDGKDVKTEIKLVKLADEVINKEATDTTPASTETWAVYRVATQEEIDGGKCVDEIITNAEGRFKIKGLDADTYFLTETQAHPGYNKLKGDVTIVVNEDGTFKKNNTPATLIEIQNNSGSEMPSTGGMGTTLFYIVGGVLLVGAAVLLITKKRMSSASKESK